MKKVGRAGSVLSAALVGATLCLASWAEDVKIVTEPLSPGDRVTVTTPSSAPAQEVTIVREPSGAVKIRHEAVTDFVDIPASIVVKVAPPEPKEEVVIDESRPDKDAVWVAGYWQWDPAGAAYEWVPGTWRRAIPNLTWHAGRWDKAGEGYEWVSGFWSPDKEMKIVKLKEAPAALREETRPVSPGAGFVWLPGYWASEAEQYVWRPGVWERPAAEGMVWINTKWYHTSSGYEFIPGHWDYPAEGRTYIITKEKTVTPGS